MRRSESCKVGRDVSWFFSSFGYIFVHVCIVYMGVSTNNGTPKSSILIGVSIINHPFWGTPIFGNIHIDVGIYTLPKTNSLHLKIGRAPKGSDCIPTIHFQVLC